MIPFRYFPTEDGPAHLGAARVMVSYRGAFTTYFELDWFPKFDLLWELMLAGLVPVLGPLPAERVLVAATVVGLPMSAAYALRGVRPGATAYAFLVLPVSVGWFLHAGYDAFCLGLVLFFCTLGWWLRHTGTWRATAVLGGLMVLTYLAHVLPFLMAVGFIAVHTAWVAWAGERQLRGTRLRAQGWRLAAAAAPSLVLLVAYLATHETGGGGVEWAGRLDLVEGLVTLRPAMASFATIEVLFTTLLALTVAGLGVYALVRVAPRRLRHPEHAWLVCAITACALYVTIPNRLGAGGNISARLSLFVLFAAVFWLCDLDLGRRAATVAVAAGLTVAVGLGAIHLPHYIDFNRDLREFTAVGRMIPRHATVVPLYFVEGDEGSTGLAASRWTHPMIQATGYLMADRDVVDLSHFEGQFSYFVTQFRPEVDPFRTIGGGENWLSNVPPDVDLLDYQAQTRGVGRIDYVLVWGMVVASSEVRASPVTADVQRQLATGYELVHTSPRGWAELYKRRA